MYKNSYLSIGICAAIASLYGTGASAQSSNTASSFALEEVMVTATKRSTSLQDTPLSISALTGDTLDKIGATSFIDYVASVPSLSLQDAGPGQRRPILRGLVGAGEPLVGTYIDEIPFTGLPNARNDSGQFGADLRLYDVNRLEALRGPQGTLYGSGSMGGTLRIILNQPDLDSFDASMQVDLSRVSEGGDPNYVVNGMINVPLVEDTLALRLVGYYEDKTGWIDNTTLGLEDLNSAETVGFRGMLGWQATDNLNLTLTAIYQDAELDGGTGLTNPRDLTNDLNAAEAFPDEFFAYNLNAEWETELYTTMVSASYFSQDSNQFSFGGNPPSPPFAPEIAAGVGIDQANDGDIFSFETRISSNYDGPVNWIGGAFYQDRANDALSSVSALDANGVPGGEIYIFERTISMEMDQSAVFGEVTYDVNDKLSLTAGLRWFDVSNFASTTVTRPIAFPQAVLVSNPTPSVTKGDESDTITKFLIDYQMTEDILVYAQYSEGFRAGGANQNVGGAPIPDSFASDSAESYELGFRTEWLDRRLTLNTAFYTTDWQNIQVNQRTPDGLFSFIGNSGSARVDGIELEATGVLSENWTVTLNGAWTDARLTDDQPQTVDSGAIRSGLDGDPLPSVPELSGSLQVEYSRTLGDGMDGYVIATASYRGSTQNVFRDTVLNPTTLASSPNSQFVDIDSYTLVNLKAGVDTDNWQGSVYVNNLEDKRAITNVTTPFGLRWRVVQPRTIGVSVKWMY